LWPWAQVLRELHRNVGMLPLAASDPTVTTELASIVPEIGAGALADDDGHDAVTARFRLFDAVEAALTRICRDQALLLVFDDIHWADAASLRLLSFLAPAARSARLLVLATYRPEAVTSDSALGTLLAELGRHTIDHQSLRGFDADEVGRFATEHLDIDLDEGACARLRERTGGNPYFVAELLRLVDRSHGHEVVEALHEIPLTVREVLRRRVATLDDEAVSLLQAASVLGRDAPVDVVAAMEDLDAAQVLALLGPAAATGIVSVSGPGRLQFAHALVREVLYEELPPSHRSRLHARAGRALLDLRAGDPGPYRAEIANHLYHGALAGTAADAVDQLELAADEAARARAFEDEVVLRGRAVELAEQVAATPARRYELLADLAVALDRVGDAARSRSVARRAVDVGERLDEPGRIATVLTGVTYANIWFRQPYGTVDSSLADLLVRVLAAMPPDDPAGRSRLLATLAETRYYEADPATREMALDAVRLAEDTGDPALLADVLLEALLAVWRPADLATSARLGEQLVDVARRARLPAEVAIAGRAVTRYARVSLGQPLDGDLAADLAAVSRLRLPFLHAQLLWQDGGFALARGDLASARRRNDEAGELVRRATSYGAVAADLMEWLLLLEVGDGDGAAAAALRHTDETPQPASTRMAAMGLAASSADDARSLLESRPGPLPDDWMWLIASCAEAELAVAGLLDGLTLLDRLDRHRHHVSMLGTMFHIGPVALYTGRIRASLGDLAGADADLRLAVEVARRVDAPLWRARSEVRLAEVLLARGAPATEIEDVLAPARRTAAERRSTTLAAMVERLTS
jgi:hypothetical protein